jgi:hypothetical protein
MMQDGQIAGPIGGGQLLAPGGGGRGAPPPTRFHTPPELE